MTNQSTPTFSKTRRPFRALFMLFLMLCLLMSCPLKRELKSAFLPDVPGHNAASADQQLRQVKHTISPAEQKLACAQTVHAILDEVETSAFFQHFEFKNPVLFLALSLAALYLLVVASTGNTTLPHAFSGGVLTAKIPLFLRHRQLVI
jgi:hypothetical protein